MIYLLLALALVAVFAVGIYNSLIKLKNKVEEAWSDIDTQLKRRYDLLPNLVETVKGYATHESETLERVIQARNMGVNAQTVHDQEQAENMISSALKSIFALAESYPDLKANTNFMNLQNTLKEIEEHIQMSRRYYNGTVRDFNTKIEVFPNNLIANILGFKKREFFQADEGERENVKVSFDKKEEAPTTPATPAAAAPTAPTEPPAAPPTPATTPAAPPAAPPAPAAPANPAEQPEAPQQPPTPPASQ